jgi:enoyl-CoA hydratase/carnithine racemase
MTTLTNDHYDRTMSFLANTTKARIVEIAANPQTLEAALSRPYPEPEALTPDTPEAAESAAAEFERDDRAEAMMQRLIKTSPATWEALKQAVHRLAPESDLETFLERQELPSIWDWQGPTYPKGETAEE